MMARPLVSMAVVGLVVFSSAAHAHYPTIDCWKKKQTIFCEVGFSDGSKARGKDVSVISYDEEILATKQADKFSRVEFQAPEEGLEYYIYFDAKHEFPIEVDYGEL